MRWIVWTRIDRFAFSMTKCFFRRKYYSKHGYSRVHKIKDLLVLVWLILVTYWSSWVHDFLSFPGENVCFGPLQVGKLPLWKQFSSNYLSSPCQCHYLELLNFKGCSMAASNFHSWQYILLCCSIHHFEFSPWFCMSVVSRRRRVVGPREFLGVDETEQGRYRVVRKHM
jgi:hypothetical protein